MLISSQTYQYILYGWIGLGLVSFPYLLTKNNPMAAIPATVGAL
ncbi:MAG: hypothetical protein U0T75_15005 [Chitinophagales bacterium]